MTMDSLTFRTRLSGKSSNADGIIYGQKKDRVIFVTKTYKNDFVYFLQDAFQKKKEAIGYSFFSHALMLNNGIPEEMKWALTSNVGCTLDVESMIPVVLDHFRLTMKRLESGFWYVIAELAAIYYASQEKYDYLCWVQGDCLTRGGDWVTPAIKILKKEKETILVSPASDVNTWHDQDGYDHYCSDQAFIGRVADLAKPEPYQVEGTDPDYPRYAPDSFEAMVGKYLKASGKKRKILSDYWVYHGAY